MSALQLEDHIVLVTGALGTLGTAMCRAIEAAGGKAIRSDLASRGKVDIALDVTQARRTGRRRCAHIETHARPARRPRQQRRHRHARRRGADAVLRVAPRDGGERRRRVPGLQVRHAAAGQIQGAVDRQHLVGLGHRRRRQPCGLQRVEGRRAAADQVGGAVRRAQAPARAAATPCIRPSSRATWWTPWSRAGPIRPRPCAKLQAQIPIGRLGQPHEVANTVVWLLSAASSFTTGSEVLVDGGLIAG